MNEPAIKMQVVFDCHDPERQARFWALALRYQLEEPPDGYRTWSDYWREVGVPEEELEDGYDRVVDPAGVLPRVWFQRVPEGKVVKNRMHLDLAVSGGRSVAMRQRRERVDAHVAVLVEAGATIVLVHDVDGLDHYAVTLHDPEGNEFCVN